MKTLLCNCNRTMALDGAAIRRAVAQVPGAELDGLDTVHTLLCRREAPQFQRAAKATAARAEPLLVACTQESRLFVELNDHTEGTASVAERPIQFVNIRETAGWSRDGGDPTPKIAALLAAAQLPPPEPVPGVRYRSAGRCLVVGPAAEAERAAAMLDDRLDVTVLAAGAGSALTQRHPRATHAGQLTRLEGWLGAFDAEWTSGNPIDLDLCTRCNACIDACPEGAIGLDYQIDLDACRGHRACVRACDAAGAIDFARQPQVQRERFDLVLDLRAEPAFARHQPPQGYAHAPDETALAAAVLRLRELQGEFDKPRFFHYQPRLCAHSRNERIGCSACLDVCSAQAIRSDASRKGKAKGEPFGGVIVEPHLCVGCGACATACPSGAMTFAAPDPAYQGRRLRTLLTAYRAGGGRDAAVLVHAEGTGQRLLEELGRAARLPRRLPGGPQGLPARVIPLPVWHAASTGIDLWLSAIAFGASQVWVLTTPEDAPDYLRTLDEQMAVAQAILTGLGYAGQHLRRLSARDARDLDALDSALRAPAAQSVARPASFAVQADKRPTLEMAIGHLVAQAPQPAETLPLPAAGAPYGTLAVDAERCTLCLSCVGACPAGALLDNPERPQLRFIEKNCVQCGLCASTCPEDAIALQPRLWWADGGRARAQPRVVAEMAPFACVRCGKPFGTLRAIENMVAKLAGHAAFQGAAAERLKMCADCRVIDLHSDPGELRINEL